MRVAFPSIHRSSCYRHLEGVFGKVPETPYINRAMSKRKIIPYAPHLKELAKQLRKEMTYAEVLLWNDLKAKQMIGFDFDRQKPIDQFIVDFYCKDLQLAIEVDGITHQWEEVQVKDEKRQKRLEQLGIRFLRFDDHEIINDKDNVLRVIEAKVRELSKE